MAGLRKQQKGFSLAEMVVVLGIMTMVLGIMIANFPKLRDQIAVSNALHALQLTLRQSQSYAIAVREFSSSFTTPICQQGFTNVRFPPYGVSMTTIDIPTDSRDASTYIQFADINCVVKTPTPPVISIYNPSNSPSEVIMTGKMQGGVYLSELKSPTGLNLDIVEIIYQRPSPSIILIGRNASTGSWANYSSAVITISSKDGSISKTVTVRTSGQISIQ